MSQILSAEPEVVNDRPMKQALLRGAVGHCPACGEGKLFNGYLKVRHDCPNCQEEFHHHRADDGPAYLTVLIVSHVIGPLILIIYMMYRPSAMAMLLGFSTAVIVSSLALLPIMKGGFVAFQWARRMHGFDGKQR